MDARRLILWGAALLLGASFAPGQEPGAARAFFYVDAYTARFEAVVPLSTVLEWIKEPKGPDDSLEPAERGKLLPTHRYTTIPHQLKAVSPIVDGRYLRAETQQAALAAAAGLPLGTAQITDTEKLQTVAGSPAEGGKS